MRAMNRLAAMQMFVRVAELASFTQAADSLGLPKASASTAVRSLEGLVGTQLLHRTTRRVELTPDGHAFYERCKDLLVDIDELHAMFRHGETLRGRLRVDMPTGTARHWIIPRLPEFLRTHPHLEVELSTTDRRVDLVREGFDCVLRIGTMRDSSLVARPLGHLRQVNLASRAYLERHGTPTSLADLKSHRLVHYVSTLGGKSPGWEYVEDGRARSLPMPGAVTVNNAGAYESACLAGLGMVQAPAAGMQHYLDNGTVVEVLPQYAAAPLPVTLIYAQRRNLAQRVRVFMDWVQEVLQPALHA